MGNIKRDKEYLGVDTNVLVAFLDKEHPDIGKLHFKFGGKNGNI